MFGSDFRATFNEGLSVIVGENGSGKSAIIDAIRLLLNEDEYGRIGISASDFHRPFDKPAKSLGSDNIKISARFNKLSDVEQVAYLPWINPDNMIEALLNFNGPGDTRHYIPRGGMFRYVSSANYFGELLEWTGFAVASWSWAGAVFAWWTFANLAPRAASLNKRYAKEFGDEFTSLGRKKIIPFIY